MHLFPYAYPLMNVVPRFEGHLQQAQTSAVVYSALLLLLAFADFNGRGRVG